MDEKSPDWSFPSRTPGKPPRPAGSTVYPVPLLLDADDFVNYRQWHQPTTVDHESLLSESQHFSADFKDVRGQQTAKRALEVAAPAATTF